MANSANIGFEEKLWAAADKMRNNMDPSEYKHVILGLIFLKYISDSFELQYKKLQGEAGANPEDKDEYQMDNVFWVPKEARWNYLKSSAKNPEIGKMIDDAMIAIERENPKLKGVLAKDYARPALDKQKLGEVIDLISGVELMEQKENSVDILGRIYEYFLGRFASAEGKGGGEFFTPQSIVKLLVNMLEPYHGRIYDPACGSGGMFVQSEKFVEAHGGKKDDLSIYGQEWNPTTWKLCMMNLAIRGINGDLGGHNGDSFGNDLHKDLKADYIIANPPFNISDWGSEHLKDDIRWKYGTPPNGNANYAWIQHFIHHLSPTGIAGFVMSNGSMSTNTSNEGEIRKNLINAGLIDCIVALPDKLFYTTSIPACLWFVSRDRYDHKFRNRHDEILFIDAHKMGTMLDRKHRELSEKDLEAITNTYHSWRNIDGNYEDKKGYSKAVKIKEIEKSGYILTPGRYVGTDAVEEDSEVFNDKIKRLVIELNEQFAQSKELEEKIKQNLRIIGSL